MKKPFILVAILVVATLGYFSWDAYMHAKGHTHDANGNHIESHQHGGHGHDHGPDNLVYTVYTDQTELFVEFKPLVVGQRSKFAAHFTKLGERFEPLTEGVITVHLVKSNIPNQLDDQLSNKANKPSSPGIFRLSIQPKEVGNYQLVFTIHTPEYDDKIVLKDIAVYAKLADVPKDEGGEEEITYLKEQAWKVEFANQLIEKKPYSEIIKTTGEVLPAQGDEILVIAKSKGVLSFGSTQKLIGSKVNKNEVLFKVFGNGLTEGNADVKYKEAQAVYEKASIDFERAEGLIAAKIIAQKDYQLIKLRYNNAKNSFESLANNYVEGGQMIKAPIQGYIKDLMVSEGEYVAVGQAIAKISQNRRLNLKAEIPQKYFSKLSSISSANFKTVYDNKVYNTIDLNGKLISYGKNASDHSFYIPIHFEIDNKGEIIPGSYVEFYLKTNEIENAIVIPKEALLEEQGHYYAYVQSSGEGFLKRELKVGSTNGFEVQILEGLNEGERVVTKGAYQIKLATMSGALPAHGHEH